MSELKCCPFCGGKPKIATCDWGYSVKEYWCYCSSCGCETQKYHSKEDAIAQWNERKPMANIVEKLEEYAKSKIRDNHKKGCPYGDNDDIFCENCGALGAINIVKQEINNGN